MKPVSAGMWRWILTTILAVALCSPPLRAGSPAVPILVYHRFGSSQADAMTVTAEHFRAQLDLLCTHKYSVIPLAAFVAWRLGKGPAPPPRSVVLTFDDGHVSVYREARPVLISRQIPVTLFIYPSCISNAPYAMTWDELKQLAANPFFAVESHTYWHPNFKQEVKRLGPLEYTSFVDQQLTRSRSVLEQRLNHPVTLLAWPFGIYDPYLMKQAQAASYQAAFSIECRAATASDPIMAVPRCLVSNDFVGSRFIQFLDSALRGARN